MTPVGSQSALAEHAQEEVSATPL